MKKPIVFSKVDELIKKYEKAEAEAEAAKKEKEKEKQQKSWTIVFDYYQWSSLSSMSVIISMIKCLPLPMWSHLWLISNSIELEVQHLNW